LKQRPCRERRRRRAVTIAPTRGIAKVLIFLGLALTSLRQFPTPDLRDGSKALLVGVRSRGCPTAGGVQRLSRVACNSAGKLGRIAARRLAGGLAAATVEQAAREENVPEPGRSVSDYPQAWHLIR